MRTTPISGRSRSIAPLQYKITRMLQPAARPASSPGVSNASKMTLELPLTERRTKYIVSAFRFVKGGAKPLDVSPLLTRQVARIGQRRQEGSSVFGRWSHSTASPSGSRTHRLDGHTRYKIDFNRLSGCSHPCCSPVSEPLGSFPNYLRPISAVRLLDIADQRNGSGPRRACSSSAAARTRTPGLAAAQRARRRPHATMLGSETGRPADMARLSALSW